MDYKLEAIKPYLKFVIQHTTGTPVDDSVIDTLCNNGRVETVQKLGNDYYLVSTLKVVKQEYGDGNIAIDN